MMETSKNRFHPNGHNDQREGLTIYLPGNGGPDTPAPGFPAADWTVRYEGLRRAI